LHIISPCRSLSGDTVFPDILANDDIGSSVRSHRSQAQRRHLNAQLNLIDCESKLYTILIILTIPSYLMDLLSLRLVEAVRARGMM